VTREIKSHICFRGIVSVRFDLGRRKEKNEEEPMIVILMICIRHFVSVGRLYLCVRREGAVSARARPRACTCVWGFVVCVRANESECVCVCARV
jgi:hypothetical protein